jgi:hypothetical protein
MVNNWSTLFLLILLFALVLTGCGESSRDSGDRYEAGNASTSSPHEGQTWQLLNASHGGDGSAWGLPDCDGCHVLSAIHPDRLNVRQIVSDKGYITCAGCHGSNGTDAPRRCLVCHNPQDLPAAPTQLGRISHNFNSDATSPLRDDNCIACHQSSNMDGEFNLQDDLTRYTNENLEHQPYQSTTDFCLRCHNSHHQQSGFEMTGKTPTDPLIAMADNYAYVDWHGRQDGSGQRAYNGLRDGYQYQSTVACTDCHAMHGTHNQKLIIGSASAGAALLTPQFRAHDFAVTIENGDFSQLCVLCHRMQTILEQAETDTGNGLAGVHATGSDCRSCHRHGQSTQVGL